MNLKDRMRSEQDISASEEQMENGTPNSTGIMPKSNQQSPERELIAKQSDLIRRLEKEVMEKTEEIRKNSSEISLLRSELRERSEIIVSLNEKIATLSESDKELQRSEQLLKQSEEMRSNALAAEREAARMISVAEVERKEAEQQLFAERNCLRREFEEYKHKLRSEYKEKVDSYRLRSYLGWGLGIIAIVLYVVMSEWFLNDVPTVIKTLWSYFSINLVGGLSI